MTSAAKRKCVSKSNQEEPLKSFYDNLGNDKDTFLGHKIVLEDAKALFAKSIRRKLSTFSQNAWKNRYFHSCKIIDISRTFY